MQNKSIVIRLDKAMLNRIKDTAKTIGVTHSQVVRDALQMYYGAIKTDNTEIITILKEQVRDLQQQRDALQQRVDYYSLPWYMKIIRSRPQLKEHNH